MSDHAAGAQDVTVPSRAIVSFVAITFAISWGILGFFIFFPDRSAALFGPLTGRHPAFVLAVWAPALAAFALVLFHGGASGLGAFLSRLGLWRCPPGWAAFLLVGVPLVFVAGSLMKGGPLLAPLPPGGLGAVLGAMLFMLFLGPVEEFGWRGMAQPILQRHVAPVWAGLLIGSVWGLWHLPAFFLSGTVQSGWGFAPFFAGNVALAVIVTPLFNVSRGSILLPALFHFQLINPLWPDAQPYDTWLLCVVAVLLVWVCRRSMFARPGPVTAVVPLPRQLRPTG